MRPSNQRLAHLRHGLAVVADARTTCNLPAERQAALRGGALAGFIM